MRPHERSLARPRDTDADAAKAHLAVLRAATTQQRLDACLRFSSAMITLSRASLRARHPELSDREVALLWVEQNYGEDLARGLRRHLDAES